DEFDACYVKASEVIQEARASYPGARIAADYTGGTKSMTAGLVVAALDDAECELRIVTGVRSDLDRVRPGTEFARPAEVARTQVERAIRLARGQLSRYDYAGAASVLESALSRHGTAELTEVVQRMIGLCRAFDAWDRFDHGAAADLIRSVRASAPAAEPYLALAHRLVAAGELLSGRRAPDRWVCGYELVDDLVLNAERRAAQGRYDDAVARLYRALELTAQVRLRTRHGVDTSAVDPLWLDERLRAAPAETAASLGERRSRASAEGSTLALALVEAWDLLASLGDPFGVAFAAARRPIVGELHRRNGSILAHGLEPIRREVWEEFRRRVLEFLEPRLEEGYGEAKAQRVKMQLLQEL
ncbi:MAG: TIGR02710 family CRISPR-associated protein, partial [Clostridia bacterium]|nr:TIGR02710 family CRISPR-associated protein [Clostridia bacterium]